MPPTICLPLKIIRGIIKLLWNLSQKKPWSGHVHKLYAWYHDPRSSSSPATCILVTCSLYYTIFQSRKREIIQSNIYRILPDVHQVIYTLDTNCMPYTCIMILAQAFIQILWSQGPLWVKCLSLKKQTIQSNIHRILRTVNQVIYIMYPNCMFDIMILARATLQIFKSHSCFTIQNAKVRQGT